MPSKVSIDDTEGTEKAIFSINLVEVLLYLMRHRIWRFEVATVRERNEVWVARY